MKKWFKEIIYYILVVLAIVLPLFFKPGYLFFTDFVLGPNVILDWQSTSFLINIIFFFFSYVFSLDILQKIFIGLVLLIVLIGAKKLIEEILLLSKNKERNGPSYWFVFIISLFALFNPFVYDRVMYGQFGVVASFGFLSFSLENLLVYFRTKKLSNITWFGIFSGLMILFSMHFVFFQAPLVILLIIYALNKKIINWKVLLKHLILALVIILVINLNWLIGLVNPNSNLSIFINKGISNQDLIAFQTSGKTNGEVIMNILMMSGFWGKDQLRYSDLTKSKENWGRSFFFLLPIILLGVWVSFRVKQTKFLSFGFIFIFTIAFVLAIGVRLPLSSQITQFLYNYFPFYRGLREPQKWVSVIVIIYLFYLIIGTKYLLQKKIIENNKLLGGLILSGIIVMQAPLLLSGFNNQVKPTQYPNDWYEVNSYITNNSKVVTSNFQKCDGNILFLPWHMYMSFNWTGNIVANPASLFFNCPTITGTNMEWGGIYDNSMDPKGRVVMEWLKKGGNTDFFDNRELNIKHVILAKELDWQDYLWIEKLPNIKLVKETQSLKLYQVFIP